MEIKLKIAQVSQIMGGAIVTDGPPRPGREVFWRALNNDGKRFYQLLPGNYKVLFAFDESPNWQDSEWRLEQADLASVGGLLMMTSNDPRQGGTLLVLGDSIMIEEGAPVATLREVANVTMCSCACGVPD